MEEGKWWPSWKWSSEFSLKVHDWWIIIVPSVDPAAAASSRGRSDPAELRGPDSSGGGHGWHQDHAARLCFQGNRELSSSPAAGSMAGKHWSHPASPGEYQTSKSWDVLWVSNISHQTSSECQTLVIRHLVSVRHQSHKTSDECQKSKSSDIWCVSDIKVIRHLMSVSHEGSCWWVSDRNVEVVYGWM